MKKLTTIPFSGFYESLHDSALDDALNDIFSDDRGIENDELVYRAWDSADWSTIHELYAKEYAENFAHEFEIEALEFESIKSPREYNFSTDRIFCHIDYAELCSIVKTFNMAEFSAFVRDRFTSRDGFISFYPAELTEWGKIETWDHNQCGTALEFYAIQESGGEFDSWKEYALMENSQCNGVFDEILYKAGGADFSRLVRLHDYLDQRENRKAE